MTGPTQNDPLLPKPNHPINPSNAANLEHAVNDVYEALVDEADDYDLDEDAVWLREQRDLNKAIHWLKRPSVLMIGFPLFIFALSFSSGDSTRRMITFKLACNYLAANSPDGKCDPVDTQLLVSNLYLAYSILSAAFMMFALGKIGMLSDQYGRKPFLIAIVSLVFVARVFKFHVMHNYGYLRFALMVISEIFGNLCGGTLSLVTLTNCYIADVVESHERIYSLGLGMASLFIGLSIGPIVGNALLSLPEAVNNRHYNILDVKTYINISEREFLPLKFELVLIFVVLMLIIFVVRESRSEKARKKSKTVSRSSLSVNLQGVVSTDVQASNWMRFGHAVNFLKPLRLLILPSELSPTTDTMKLRRIRIVILILVTTDCMLTGMGISLMEIYVLFGIYRFNWNSIDIGHLMAVACSTRAVVLIVLSPLITHRLLQKGLGFRVLKNQFDMIDFAVCSLGLLCQATGLFLLNFAPSTTWFLLAMSIMSFGALASPSLNSSIIKFFPESKIGELFGAISLLKNLFSLAGPAIFLSIYKSSLAAWNIPGVVFLVSGFLMMLGAFGILMAKRLLNLDRNNVPLLTRRLSTFSSTSSVESFDPSTTDVLVQGNKSSDDPLNHKMSFSNIHRKNSFVHKQRNLPE